MTLKELAKEYRESAQLLRVRLKELRAAKKATADPEELFWIRQRMRTLEPMLTRTNKIAELLEHYYEGGFWRDPRITSNSFIERRYTCSPKKRTSIKDSGERADGGPEEYVASVLREGIYGDTNCGSKRRKQVHGESRAEKSRRKNSENIKVPLTTADVDNIVNQFLRKKEK